MSTTLVRRVGLITATALLSGTALIAPIAPAYAATPPTPLGQIAVSGLPTDITVPYDAAAAASTVVPLTVQFAGEPTDVTDANADGWKVAYGAVDSGNNPAKVEAVDVHSSSPLAPDIEWPATVEPNTALAYKLTITDDTTPGRYRITIPITQATKATNAATTTSTQTATLEFNVLGNTKVVDGQTGYSMRGKYSKKVRWTGSADLPDYMAGSTVKVYYKAKGKKKYTVVATGKLDGNGDTALKTKKGAIRKKGNAYLSVSAVAYVPAFKTGVVKVK